MNVASDVEKPCFTQGAVVPDQPPFSSGALGTRDPASDFLQISHLSKSFGAVPVIDNLSLTVQKGEFVSLLGPSGCGKTTTLRIIAGFVAPGSGEILLDGERIDQVPSHRRGAVMVFQNYALFPHMTVAENVGFGLRMQKLPKAEIQSRVDDVLRQVQLETFTSRYPRELSGGQQQRVALARAVVLKPKLLLLDEPLSNLDAKLRKELRTEFLKIHQLAGTTTVFVTHDLEEAFAVSDRVAVMNRGRIEQYDTPVSIFNRPASAFVAEFIGHSNVIAGLVEKGDGDDLVLRCGGAVLFRVRPDLTPGQSVRLAIPAHLIAIVPEPTQSDNCVSVLVEASSYLGSTVHYALNASGLRLHAEVPVGPNSGLLQRGDHAYACWRASDFIPLGADHA